MTPNVPGLWAGGAMVSQMCQFKTKLPNTKPTLNKDLNPRLRKTPVSRSVFYFILLNSYSINSYKFVTALKMKNKKFRR